MIIGDTCNNYIQLKSITKCKLLYAPVILTCPCDLEQNQSTTWLCLDGPLNPGWADNFNPILNGDKVTPPPHLPRSLKC